MVAIDIAAERRRSLLRQGLLEPEPEQPPCARPGCEKPKHPHHNAKYCSPQCRDAFYRESGKLAKAHADYRERLRNGEIGHHDEARIERNRRIVEMRREGKSIREIQEIVGLHYGTVHAICTGAVDPKTHVWVRFPVEREAWERWKQCAAGRRQVRDWMVEVLNDHADRRLNRW